MKLKTIFRRPIDVFSLYVLFSHSDHVMVPDRTVFFKFRLIKVHPRAYVCIINEKTKGKFPGKFFRDLNWENRTYKVKRCIG